MDFLFTSWLNEMKHRDNSARLINFRNLRFSLISFRKDVLTLLATIVSLPLMKDLVLFWYVIGGMISVFIRCSICFGILKKGL